LPYGWHLVASPFRFALESLVFARASVAKHQDLGFEKEETISESPSSVPAALLSQLSQRSFLTKSHFCRAI
jgi:hypothetical protein